MILNLGAMKVSGRKARKRELRIPLIENAATNYCYNNPYGLLMHYDRL